MVLKSKDVGADFFVPGRMAMTCCADDTSFIGYVCKCASAKSLVMGSWVDVTATVKWGYMKVYDGEGPVLYAKEVVIVGIAGGFYQICFNDRQIW